MFMSAGRFQGASKSIGAGDPNFANVALLLHFDGNNGDTTTVDKSNSPLVGTFGGSSTIATAQAKFGPSSLLGSNGLPNGIRFASDARFNFGQTNYTLEGWFYPTDVSSGSQQIMFQFNGAVNYNPWFGIIGGTMYLRGINTGNNIVAPFAHGMSTNTWYHIALVKNGTTFTIYIDGVQKASATSSFVTSENKSFSVGGGTIGTGYLGYMDEVRLTQAVSRYLTGFTPPTAPFPNF